jgi:putative membrane protein
MNDKMQNTTTIKKLSALALDRTAYSSERSVMAWMRTSVSMYAFGFTIIKFIDYLRKQEDGAAYAEGLGRLGLVLILIGIMSLVLAIIEHLKRVRTMKRLGLEDPSRMHLSIVGAALLLVVGITTLIGLLSGYAT